MNIKKNRRLKVYGQSNGYNYKEVSTIVLKGKWLEAIGFDIGTDLIVVCEDGKLTISAVNGNYGLMESAE